MRHEESYRHFILLLRRSTAGEAFKSTSVNHTKEKTMFDSNREYEMQSLDGSKKVAVRFPSDEELVQRTAKSKTLVRSIGRGKTITESLGNEKNDLDLYEKIRLDGSADLDEFEATRVVNRLVRAEVTDSQREGAQFSVTLDVPGGQTVHVVRMPSAKQVIQYRRAAVHVIDGRRGAQEIRLNLQAAGELYDTLFVSSEGYTDATPITHKQAAIGEIMSVLDAEEDDSEITGFMGF